MRVELKNRLNVLRGQVVADDNIPEKGCPTAPDGSLIFCAAWRRQVLNIKCEECPPGKREMCAVLTQKAMVGRWSTDGRAED